MKLRYGIIIVAALLFFGAVFYFHDGIPKARHFLELRDSVSGKLFRKWPVEEGGEFAIEFIHSVHQSPVKETFIIERKMIKPLSVRFFSFGAGMLSDLGDNLKLSRDGDALVITGFDSSFEELNYIVGTVSDHVLFIDDEVVSLRELCGKNAHVNIKIK